MPCSLAIAQRTKFTFTINFYLFLSTDNQILFKDEDGNLLIYKIDINQSSVLVNSVN